MSPLPFVASRNASRTTNVKPAAKAQQHESQLPPRRSLHKAQFLKNTHTYTHTHTYGHTMQMSAAFKGSVCVCVCLSIDTVIDTSD